MSTKRHHYLPQFYLANFIAPGENGFVVYDKQGATPRWQTPINTGVEGHLFTTLGPSGVADDTLETDILSPLDSSVAPILARWIEGESLDARDFPCVAAFMASLHARAPRQIVFHQEVAAAAVVKCCEELASNPDAFTEMMRQYNEANPSCPVEDLEALRQCWLRREAMADFTVDRQLALLQSIGQIKEITQALLEMGWLVCKADPGQHFVVGDSPLSVIVPHSRSLASFGCGFLHARAEVALPLSPDRCLYLKRWPLGPIPPTRELNRRIICQAERFVVSPCMSEEIGVLIAEFAFTVGQPKIDRDDLLRHIRNDEKAEPEA